jgi:hypothetical protein
VFGLAGGIRFGPMLCRVIARAGGATGATPACLVGRHLAGDRVARRAGGPRKLAADEVEADGRRTDAAPLASLASSRCAALPRKGIRACGDLASRQVDRGASLSRDDRVAQATH